MMTTASPSGANIMHDHLWNLPIFFRRDTCSHDNFRYLSYDIDNWCKHISISGETTAGLTPYLLEPEGLTPYPLEEDTSGLQPYLLHGLQPVLLSTLMETTTTLEPAPTLTTTLEPAPTLPPYNPAPSPPPFCKYCKCRTATASSTPPSFSGIYVVYLFCYNRIGLRM